MSFLRQGDNACILNSKGILTQDLYKIKQESLAPASMARDDPPASSMQPKCAVKWDQNLKPKLVIMRQCTSVTDRRTERRTDGLASWHKCEMYILHLALKRLELPN